MKELIIIVLLLLVIFFLVKHNSKKQNFKTKASRSEGQAQIVQDTINLVTFYSEGPPRDK